MKHITLEKHITAIIFILATLLGQGTLVYITTPHNDMLLGIVWGDLVGTIALVLAVNVEPLIHSAFAHFKQEDTQ